jgi:hypothetical protein
MKYYVVEPEVAGGMGPATVLDRSRHPPMVKKLHYEFEGWLGDELLTAFPAYIVTRRVQEALELLPLTGAEFDDVETSRSSTFEELYPGRQLPAFQWLRIVGQPGVDDFGMSRDHLLVVSERVLDCLRRFPLANCETRQYPGAR